MPLLLVPVQTRSALYVSETATSTLPGLPDELRGRGKTGKDGDWEEIRHVESDYDWNVECDGVVIDAFRHSGILG